MKTEILSIGTELTNGRNLDTNAQWLSRQLTQVGVPVQFHTTVADDFDDNVAVFRLAVERASLVVVTGGLGPTADDLTREVLAKVAGVELKLDRGSLAHIEGMFARRSRVMPDRNKVQAYFPEGATVVPNEMGTAPGIWMEVRGSVVVCLPGVPREMNDMFIDWVLPRIRSRFGAGRAMAFRTLRCFGAGESHVEELLGDMIRRGREPEVGITASEATISLRIVATGATPEEAEAKTLPDVEFIRQRLGRLVYGEEDDTLQSAVGRLLLERKQTVATAESCTGGLVGHFLTEVPGSSQYYLGGVVAYSNEAKSSLVGVPAEMIAEYGAVSPQVAKALAEGCRTLFGADYGVGVTGVAGPGGGTADKPVGLVYFGVAHAGGVEVGQYNWPGDRTAVKHRSAKTALNLLRLQIIEAG